MDIVDRLIGMLNMDIVLAILVVNMVAILVLWKMVKNKIKYGKTSAFWRFCNKTFLIGCMVAELMLLVNYIGLM